MPTISWDAKPTGIYAITFQVLVSVLKDHTSRNTKKRYYSVIKVFLVENFSQFRSKKKIGLRSLFKSSRLPPLIYIVLRIFVPACCHRAEGHVRSVSTVVGFDMVFQVKSKLSFVNSKVNNWSDILRRFQPPNRYTLSPQSKSSS